MKMNYIKHVDLYDYLENHNFFLKRYFNTFQYLLFAIQKLAVNNIVHYDMHLGNVVINKANNFADIIFKNVRKKIYKNLKIKKTENIILNKRVNELTIDELLWIYNFI